MNDFIMMVIIGLTIFFVLIALWIKYFIDFCIERAEFIQEVENHNRELGYKE